MSGDQFGTSGRDSRSGAVLNCWGGEWWVFLVIATKVNLFYNGIFQDTASRGTPVPIGEKVCTLGRSTNR